MDQTKRDIRAVLESLIYHGRNFSSKRDEIVLKKSYDRILEIYSNLILTKDETV